MNQNKDFLKTFFMLTFAITWGVATFAIFMPNEFRALFGELTDTSPLYYLAVAAPTISATLLALAQARWTGLRDLYARLFRWRFGFQWYLLILVVFPGVGWLATQITGASPLKPVGNFNEFLWLMFYVFSTGPLCEELGWRGYALPRLLKRFTPLTASLILGGIWGIWHLPSFFLGGMVQNGMSLPLFLSVSLCLSILVTWVFQHTGESVLSAVLVHFAVNVCTSFLGVTLPTIAGLFLIASLLVLTFDRQMGWSFSRNLVRGAMPVGEIE